MVTAYGLHTGLCYGPTALYLGGILPTHRSYPGGPADILTGGYSHTGPLRGLHTYVYLRQVFASQTPLKMRAQLAYLRYAHSAWIRTGALTFGQCARLHRSDRRSPRPSRDEPTYVRRAAVWASPTVRRSGLAYGIACGPIHSLRNARVKPLKKAKKA